jgi:hypothetical protein
MTKFTFLTVYLDGVFLLFDSASLVIWGKNAILSKLTNIG